MLELCYQLAARPAPVLAYGVVWSHLGLHYLPLAAFLSELLNTQKTVWGVLCLAVKSRLVARQDRVSVGLLQCRCIDGL